MKLRLPLTKSRHLTIISAYAPTLTNSDETKEKFYEDLDQLIRSTSPSDKLLIMGDFNARVGKDQSSWKRILGSQGVGKININGLPLLKAVLNWKRTRAFSRAQQARCFLIDLASTSWCLDFARAVFTAVFGSESRHQKRSRI